MSRARFSQQVNYRFVDPGMVIISNPRRFTALMAQASFKRKIIGAAARSLNASRVFFVEIRRRKRGY